MVTSPNKTTFAWLASVPAHLKRKKKWKKKNPHVTPIRKKNNREGKTTHGKEIIQIVKVCT